MQIWIIIYLCSYYGYGYDGMILVVVRDGYCDNGQSQRVHVSRRETRKKGSVGIGVGMFVWIFIIIGGYTGQYIISWLLKFMNIILINLIIFLYKTLSSSTFSMHWTITWFYCLSTKLYLSWFYHFLFDNLIKYFTN